MTTTNLITAFLLVTGSLAGEPAQASDKDAAAVRVYWETSHSSPPPQGLLDEHPSWIKPANHWQAAGIAHHRIYHFRENMGLRSPVVVVAVDDSGAVIDLKEESSFSAFAQDEFAPIESVDQALVVATMLLEIRRGSPRPDGWSLDFEVVRSASGIDYSPGERGDQERARVRMIGITEPHVERGDGGFRYSLCGWSRASGKVFRIVVTLTRDGQVQWSTSTLAEDVGHIEY